MSAVAASLMLLSACGAPPDKAKSNDASLPSSIALEKDVDPNAEFSFGYTYPNSSLDPVKSASGQDQTYMYPIYDRLLYLTEDGKFEPMLATSWEESADKTALTLKLRDNLKFSDGVAFNAEAVKVNLDRAKGAGSKIAQEIATLTDVQVVDDLTVKLTVSSGLGALLTSLAARPGMIASPKAIAEGTMESAPAGIGPYVATDIVPGASISYKKSEGYWDPDAQKVATMAIKSMPEDQTRLNALKSGELSGIQVSPDQRSSAESTGATLISRPSYLVYFLAVNTSVAPFDDPSVRLAMNYLIDRKAIGDGLLGGSCTPQIQPWPESSVGYDKKIGDGLDVWPHDVKKAKDLLKKAGLTKGSKFKVVTTNLTTTVKILEVLQEQFKEAGLDIEAQPVPAGGITEHFAITKQTPVTLSAYTGSPDPAAVIDRNLLPESQYNPGGATSQNLIDTAVEGASATDPATRTATYSKFMDLFIKEPTSLMPICAAHSVMALADGVSNVTMPADAAYQFRGVAVKKK
ncbi:ABC transporter substrate-binding protein [Antricoccus suffuscus]|nr:ABC transporter substrate-binding protein [Antricoccus suffuscus]